MALTPSLVAASYSPISGLPTGANRGGGSPTAPASAAPFVSGPAAPAPTTPSTPGDISFGGTPASPGYTPDWSKLIQGDPGLLQEEALMSGGSIADQASRDAAIKQAIAGFGDPNLDVAGLSSSTGLSSGDLSSILTPDVLGLAKQNTAAGTSTEARLSALNTQAVGQIKNALNARGLLNSGESGYQLGKQQQDYTNSEFDARSKMLQALQGYQQGFLNSQLQREQTLAGAYGAAANRVQQAYPSVPPTPATPGTTAHWIGADTGGNDVYMDSGGNLYDSSGNPYGGTAAGAGPIGMGTGPYRPDPQTAAYAARHVSRFGF